MRRLHLILSGLVLHVPGILFTIRSQVVAFVNVEKSRPELEYNCQEMMRLGSFAQCSVLRGEHR